MESKYLESLPRLEQFAANFAIELVRFVRLAVPQLVDATSFESPELLVAVLALVPQLRRMGVHVEL